MRHHLPAVLAGVAVAATGCTSSHPAAAGPQRAVFTFSCCAARDVNRTYHPGDVITLHWIRVSQGSEAEPKPTPIALRVSLSGGFGSVESAKSGSAEPEAVVRAATVHVTDLTTTTPISRVQIPSDATAGFYNLTTSTDSGGTIASGTMLIRIE